MIVLATPVYAFFCTAPMKALLDRAIYAGNKNYGRTKGAALLNGKRVASIVTCGYRPDRGADLWEEGLRRWCKHGGRSIWGCSAAGIWGNLCLSWMRKKSLESETLPRPSTYPSGWRKYEQNDSIDTAAADGG